MAMSDLIHRLRGNAEPVGKLLLEAADALQAAHTRIAELTETLRAVIEIGNSQRSREFADVKRTLLNARVLLSGGSLSPPMPAAAAAPAPSARPAPVQAAPVAPAPPPATRAEETKPRDEEIVSGMYKEIQSLLRHSA
jgi:pyruvate/2-oxoglutarate dehydrogenase complex dihydrolipoamide acyltransferase (E2) component